MAETRADIDFEALRMLDRTSEVAERCPFYARHVPSHMVWNLAWRQKARNLGFEGSAHASTLWAMCARDPLFWINTFVYTSNKRCDPSRLPFNTYPYQNYAVLDLWDSIGRHDVAIRKSRQMGASWLCLTLLVWEWLFKDEVSHLMVSRNEDYVDKAGNPKSLFWKVDYILSNLPTWMVPAYSRSKLKIENQSNGSVINGESTTGDVGRGDNRRVILLDEYGAFGLDDGFKALDSTQAATNTRWFNSTPQGMGNAYAKVVSDPELDRKLLTFHWSQHPVKVRGLYRSASGKLEMLGDEDDWPDSFKPVLDGKVRSPWYDKECRRTPIPTLIAQELDIDFHASGSQFFDPTVLMKLLGMTPREPLHVGELQYSDEVVPGKFEPALDGRLSLWINPSGTNEMPDDRKYTVGADISLGTGASNSVISVWDCKTGEKVASYVDSHTSEHDLARYSVALCRWFKGASKQGAYLIWEANGPGRTYGQAVLDLGYGNIYHRRDDLKIGAIPTDFPGWWTNDKNKALLLRQYQVGLARGDFVNRDRASLDECQYFENQADGTVAHASSRSSTDAGGARSNHGDRVIADALACWVMGRGQKVKIAKKPEETLCLAHRRKLRKAAAKNRSFW